jgi:Rieske Fe-S protein
MRGIQYTFALLAIALVFTTCKKNQNQNQQGDFFNPVNVDFYVNLNLPGYADLQFANGYVYEQGQGYKQRGIIIYNTGFEGQEKYVAFDRSCPVNVDSVCSYVSVETSGIFYKCGQFNGSTFTSCCGSRFVASNGSQIEGPAKRGLRQYYVRNLGSQLHITATP